MILIALGANLPSPEYGAPLNAVEQAVIRLEKAGIRVAARSRWYETAPVPISDQPWYVNGVIAVETRLAPTDLMHLLHRIEADFGRIRTGVNAARILDLDLLAYGGEVNPQGWPTLPHPRMSERAFVLHPLADIAPDWRHPVSDLDLGTLIDRLDPCQTTRVLNVHDGPGVA